MSQYKSNPVAIKGFRDVRFGDINQKRAMCNPNHKKGPVKVQLEGTGPSYALACANLCIERNNAGKACQTFTYIIEGSKSTCVMHNDRTGCGVTSAQTKVPSNMFPFIYDPATNPDGWEPTPDPPKEADSFLKPAMVPGGPPPPAGGGGGGSGGGGGGGGISVGPQPGQSTAPRQGGGSSTPAPKSSSLMGMLVILAVFLVLLGGLYFLHKKSGILTKIGIPPIKPGSGPEGLLSKFGGGGKSKSKK